MKRQHQPFAASRFVVLVCLSFLHQAGYAQPIVYDGANAASGLSQLRVINSDGTGDRIIPLALPEPGFPSFSKDGRFMAVTSQTPGRPNQSSKNVFLLNLLTAELSQITPFEDQVSATNFAFALPWYHSLSPDSSAIAIWSFVRTRDGTAPYLQTYRVSDGLLLNTLLGNRVLTGRTQGGNGVDWHATQNLLVYAVDIDVAIYLPNGTPTGYNTEGTALFVGPANQPPNRQLTFPVGEYFYLNNGSQIITTGQADYVPAFSPNGLQVAYVRAKWVEDSSAPGFRRPSILELRILNVDGSNDHQVIQLDPGVYVTHLSWSRDGTQLVFDAGSQLMLSGLPYNGADPVTDALWIINTNGTGIHTVRGPLSGFPAWSPAGTTFCNLAVTAGGGAAGSIDDCGAPLNLKGTRIPSGQYRLDISGGASNLLYRVLASTNLTTWQTLGWTRPTNTITSFTDVGASSSSRRFYRVVVGN